jgi:hypothetical protein
MKDAGTLIAVVLVFIVSFIATGNAAAALVPVMFLVLGMEGWKRGKERKMGVLHETG